jgi:Fe-S-cluster containining protein
MPKNPFYAQGLRFSCTRCSSCFRLEPGYVFLSQKDLDALSATLCLDPAAFLSAYCRWIPVAGGVFHLSLREKNNYDCILWQDGGCSAYAARPLQCRTFPFWPSALASPAAWKEETRRCPGMGKGELHNAKEIEAHLRAQLQNPVLVQGRRVS